MELITLLAAIASGLISALAFGEAFWTLGRRFLRVLQSWSSQSKAERAGPGNTGRVTKSRHAELEIEKQLTAEESDERLRKRWGWHRVEAWGREYPVALGLIIGCIFLLITLFIANQGSGSNAAPRTKSVAPKTQGKPAGEAGQDGRSADAEGPTPQTAPTSVVTRTSIVELSEKGKAEHLGFSEGDYGTQKIGGHPYTNGVSMLVYGDGTGQSKLAILTEGQFSKISGVVGIDSHAPCVEVPASVSIVDDRGVTLWGPKTVDARSRVPFSADIRGAIRVYLTQASFEDVEEVCGANPAWGNVYLVDLPEA